MCEYENSPLFIIFHNFGIKSMNYYAQELVNCLASSFLSWNMFSRVRKSRRYPNYKIVKFLAVLNRTAKKSVYNSKFFKKCKITPKLRGKNWNTWEYEGPVFPQSCSDLT